MTPAQAEVADAILAGVARGDLAAHLGVTRRTVDGRLDLMKRALKVRSYAELGVVLRTTRPHANQTIERARQRPRQWYEV